jgi:sugar lactone lactonase YvrE
VSTRGEALGHIKANEIFLSPDQSIFYVSEPTGKWVWSYQVQADGTLAYGEPFFRMETPDESSDSGAMGMARDSRGFFYVATFLGIQVCEPEGRVFAIFDGPEGVVSSHGIVSSLAFGGADHQYLYAMAGNKVFRRHLVRRGGP